MNPIISIIMGSESDWEVMKDAGDILKRFDIPHEMTIVSAHRSPDRMSQYSKDALSRGIKVIIAGAGGAAHLPGMVAANTTLPVIGVPIKSFNSIDGWDSILSILQMPTGVPVATVALNGSKNAAILAIQILAIQSTDLSQQLIDYKKELETQVMDMVKRLNK